jgi:hypothetical protein
MGTWRVTSDLLAKARFTVSPKAEAVTALRALLRPSDPAARAFRAAHHVAFEAMLDERPVRRDLLSHSTRPRQGSQPGWVAHYLASPPPAPGATFEAELAAVAATPADVLRADLRETVQRALPRSLETGDVTQEAEFVLEWVWTHAVATDWPRRERLLRADIVARTGQLARHGWAAVLRDLGKGREWAGDGQLRINRYDRPTRVLSDDADLSFIPVTSPDSWVGWTEPVRYAIYYPVAGRLAPPSPFPFPSPPPPPPRHQARRPRPAGRREPGGAASLARPAARPDAPSGGLRAAGRGGRQPPAGPARRRRRGPPPFGPRRPVLAHRARRGPDRRRRTWAVRCRSGCGGLCRRWPAGFAGCCPGARAGAGAGACPGNRVQPQLRPPGTRRSSAPSSRHSPPPRRRRRAHAGTGRR